jgi:hypothetical protein
VRTVGSATGRLGRALAVAGLAVTLATGAAACAKTVSGSAEAGPAPRTSSAPPPSSESDPPSSSGSPDSGSPAAQAQQTCSQLPKDAVTSSFGVHGVTVTADSGTTLAGGILQIKCVVSASDSFRANVVVQIYPGNVLSDANQYLGIMQQKFPSVHTITVKGADVAGTFQQTVDGAPVDEAFAAKKDTDNGTVDVVLAGVADTPGVNPKLVAFITALANA